MGAKAIRSRGMAGFNIPKAYLIEIADWTAN
jgi:hypothetical protein